MSVVDYLGPEGFGSYEVDWDGPNPTFTRVNHAAETLLVPGFIDLHFHGAFGIDFMSATEKDLEALCSGIRSHGYEGLLLTTVTARAADVSNALAAIPDDPLILGFHLEGPFISPQFPGAQPPQFIVDAPTEASEWDPIFEDPRLKVVTLAPEQPHTLQLTSRLSQRGVIVSMGHTNATYDEARFGFEFGATHTTHTCNAMRGFHHREAGALGYALTNDSIACELIYDRKHVSRDAAKLLFKAKPIDKIIAVSDSSAATGQPPNQYFEMWGMRVETERGAVRIAGTDTLAGSAVTLLEIFQNLWEDFGVETAIRLCSINPRLALGITREPRVYCEFDKQRKLVGMKTLR